MPATLVRQLARGVGIGLHGALRKDLTSDGIHLNGAGYRIWVDTLRPYLTALAGGAQSS